MTKDQRNGLERSVVSSAWEKHRKTRWNMPFWCIPVAFFMIEVYALIFLSAEHLSLWPLAFGTLWACILTGLAAVLPVKVGRILFAAVYFMMTIYTAVQTGYYLMFSQMMWFSDFRYASEGAEFFSVLLQYPVSWWLLSVGMLALGVLLVWKYPVRKVQPKYKVLAALVALASVCGTGSLPKAVFQYDRQIQFAGTDYGRAQSAEAAYDNMFNAHRLYQVCGTYQTAFKDIYRNMIYPAMPGYASAREEAIEEIDAYFADRGDAGTNDMTGVFAGKNVVFVLMESMDDWVLGEHTPTINRLMEEGICFTNFYTPVYGSVRTFNSEFCANTGTFLSSQGGYAFDYVTNDFSQSMASLLSRDGYSARVYHYNSPDFYSRGVFSPAMGYESYVCYEDYITDGNTQELYDDQFLFNNAQVSDNFFREGKKLNFIITRSAHLSYQYNEVLSAWGLRQYPHYRGMTGSEEEDCMYLKARLVDDMFTRLLQELETRGELENTVIVACTDHYSYGFKNQDLMMERSNVKDPLLLERTPCFIWSPDGPNLKVDKTLNTADLLPTVLNLLGVDSPYEYIGRDAFDGSYVGYALFPNGSWVCDGVAYSASNERITVLEEGKKATRDLMVQMAQTVNEFVYINNLILETDYYAKK